MGRRELAAAGIDPALWQSYLACRRLNAAYGKTYYVATLLLPPAKRPFVHALYGFARYADELVDAWPQRPDRLAALGRLASGGIDAAADEDPILTAVADTMERWSIPASYFETFLDSMRMDLSIKEYETYDELTRYVYGSAGVIGLQMLPILEPLPGMSGAAEPCAIDLGIGFQLTNFLRDIGEDLGRGRLYLPLEDLRRFRVSREQLAAGVVDANLRRLLAFEIDRARALLRNGVNGIEMLHPTSRDCIRAAATLYGGILDAIERADYRVLDRRVKVGPARRASVVLPGMVRAWRSRRRAGAPTTPTSTRSAR